MSNLISNLHKIEGFLDEAKGIAWDTCHKVYILMDDQEVEQSRKYGYDPLITSDEMTPAQMLGTVLKWYRDSCELRFISATRTTDTGTEFFDVVPQFFEEDEDEDE